MDSGRKATSRDVASLAGVSQTTVSYVMSGRRPVSDRTRQRVLEAMEELGYSPDASARALRSRRARVIGAMVPYRAGADAAAQHELIIALARRARMHGYDLLTLTTDEGVAGVRRVVSTGLCDGLLIMEVIDDDPRAREVTAATTPAVFIGLPGHPGAIAIDADYEAAGRQAVAELVARGHGHLHLVGSADESVRALGFLRRFAQGACQQARSAEVGLAVHSAQPGLSGALSAVAAMRPQAGEAIILGPLIDADDWANALERQGLRPGQEISLLASAWRGAHAHSPYEPARFEMGNEALAEQAVDLLIAHVEDDGAREAEPILLPVALQRGNTLITRDSPAASRLGSPRRSAEPSA